MDEVRVKVVTSPLRLCIVALFALALASCTHDPTPKKIEKTKDPNTVSFQSSASGLLGGGLTLTGRLKRPAGGGPFPAIVLLHGCGGMQGQRDQLWAERLSGWGYVTLQVDSFRPRGLSSVCTYSGKDAAEIIGKRIDDAFDAKRYLAGMPFVDRSRIAVMGWSHGGRITLETAYRKTEDPFRAAVAFYPSCRRPLTGLNAPLLILIGEKDDWTPAARCVAAMPKAPNPAASDVVLKVYPGAYHGFDRPGNSTDVRGATGMHHLEYEPEAEADAIIRVKAFLERYLD
jgi:dienelactone hydrolase